MGITKTNEKHGRSPFFLITESLVNYKNSALNSIQIIHIIQERLNVELAFKGFERILKKIYIVELSNEISLKFEKLKREFVNFSSFAFKKKKNYLKEIFKLRYYYFNKLFNVTLQTLVKAILDSPFDFIFKKIFFLLRQINLAKFNVGIAHTPLFFKRNYLFKKLLLFKESKIWYA